MLPNLTYNKVLSFTPDNVITNLYSYKNYHEGADILKYGHEYSVSPERLSHTYAFVNFDLIHLYLMEELINRDDESSLRSNLSHLANSCNSNCKPTTVPFKKHGILKKFQNNEDIVMLSPDKDNSLVHIIWYTQN